MPLSMLERSKVGTFVSASHSNKKDPIFCHTSLVARTQRMDSPCISFESRGIPTYPRFGPREHFAFRHFLFPFVSGASSCLGLYFSIFFSPSCGTMELGWAQQLLLFAPVVAASSLEGRIGERQTCTGRGSILVTCTEQINSTTDKEGGRKERKKEENRQNKQDGWKIL